MSEQNNLRDGSNLTNKIGFFQDLLLRIKLILRLMGDRRVNPLVKLIPIGSLIYLLMPGFIPPDLIPGPIDDAAVIGLGAYLFIEFCPPDVVEEHMQFLYQKTRNISRASRENQANGYPSTTGGQTENQETIDGEFKEVDQ